MEYKIVYSKRKSLGIQISRSGEVIVRAPRGVKVEFIDSVIKQKEDWIKSKLESVNQYGFSFSEGDTVLYLGEKYSIHFTDSNKIEVKDNLLLVPNGLDIENLKNWYKFKAEKLIIARFKELAKDYDYKNIRLSNAKTRYGSCNSKGNINLSWRLIFTPTFVIDYVILHELEHLNHMNHSKQFWNSVEQILPDYKLAKKWLKENNVMSLF